MPIRLHKVRSRLSLIPRGETKRIRRGKQKYAHLRPFVESLEPRWMLAANVAIDNDSGNITITGSEGRDEIRISFGADNTFKFLSDQVQLCHDLYPEPVDPIPSTPHTVVVNGAAHEVFDLSSIVVDGLGG